MNDYKVTLIDCTLRDGGYYTNWDFSEELVSQYINAMADIDVGFVEIGLRSLKNDGFKGAFAYSTDGFINNLSIPINLANKIGVMINGSELLQQKEDLVNLENNSFQIKVLQKLFAAKKDSPVTLVRVACHVHEFEACLSASIWLKKQGYLVGFNLMQVADCSCKVLTELAEIASKYPIDVLYFADSMGSLSPNETEKIVKAFQAGWRGPLGIHTHDNMGKAIMNSLKAIETGVTWVDATVTGMGRGPGNAQTEYLALSLHEECDKKIPLTKLFELIRKCFKPMQNHYGWGKNPYYYLTGKHSIHPSYVQEMLSDNRYSEEDILAVISHLSIEGGKTFNINTLEGARSFYAGRHEGTWCPINDIENKDVLIIGAGPGTDKHSDAIENFIKKHSPYVIALNSQKSINEALINVRAACHPVRLLADCKEYLALPQPLVTPASMLPRDVKEELTGKVLLDFGFAIKESQFKFNKKNCVLPNSLVVGYALAIATSGQARKIFLVGFDGYGSDDPRSKEMSKLLLDYRQQKQSLPLTSLTPTRYEVDTQSIYAQEFQE